MRLEQTSLPSSSHFPREKKKNARGNAACVRMWTHSLYRIASWRCHAMQCHAMICSHARPSLNPCSALFLTTTTTPANPRALDASKQDIPPHQSKAKKSKAKQSKATYQPPCFRHRADTLAFPPKSSCLAITWGIFLSLFLFFFLESMVLD